MKKLVNRLKDLLKKIRNNLINYIAVIIKGNSLCLFVLIIETRKIENLKRSILDVLF